MGDSHGLLQARGCLKKGLCLLHMTHECTVGRAGNLQVGTVASVV